MKNVWVIGCLSTLQTLTFVSSAATTMNPLLPSGMSNGGISRSSSTSGQTGQAPIKMSTSTQSAQRSASSSTPRSSNAIASPSGSSPGSPGAYTPVTQTLADGSSYRQGSFNDSLKWQSSGVLQHGGCPVAAVIGDCYSMYLSADGMLEPMEGKSQRKKKAKKNQVKRAHPRQLDGSSLDFSDPYDTNLLGVDSPHEFFQSILQQRSLDINLGGLGTDLDGYKHLVSPVSNEGASSKGFSSSSACKQHSAATSQGKKGSASGEGEGEGDGGASQPAPRQRIEILSWPPAASGQTWDYQWKMHVDSRTRTSKGWYHMMQLLQRSGCGGYVIAQDAEKGSVVIKDKNRQCAGGKCATYSYDQYSGRTMLHHLRVTYGVDGVFSYMVVDSTTGQTVLQYSTVGDMGSSSSVKFGIYRAAVSDMGEARAYVGDYAARRMA